MGDNLPAVNLGTGRTAAAITAGESPHLCRCSTTAPSSAGATTATASSGSGTPTTAATTPNEMGDNLPAVNLGTGRTVVGISAGDDHTCALLDNGTIKCWGNNGSGQLGLGDTDDPWRRPDEMGDNLPAIDLGTGRTVTSITTGDGHTCALLDDGTIKCWGANASASSASATRTTRGDHPGEMGDNLPAVNLGTGHTVVAITTGNGHTCALLDDGTFRCWGANTDGQLGLGDTNDRGDDTGEMGDNLPAVLLARGASAVTGGGLHFCARVDNFQVTCWGWNQSGQLGVGNTEAQGDEPGEMAALPVTIALFPMFRPDGSIRRGALAFAGTNVVNTTGAGQTRSATVGNRGTARFTVRLQNDGNFTDSLRVRGQPTTTRFTITYKRGTANVTNQVVAGPTP